MHRRFTGAPAPGFTLIELMVAIGVFAVLAFFAVPNLRSFTSSNQAAMAKSALMATLALAHSEAARQGQAVVLRGLGPKGNEYGGGWSLALASGDQSLRTYEPVANVRLAGDPEVTFSPTGAVAPPAAHTFTVCPQAGGAGWSVELQPSGMADVDTKKDC
jgi:type IV fimbrial biogenesis protein FimT